MNHWRIPLTKPDVGQEELEAVQAVFESGMLTQGQQTKKFEEEFARYLKVKHAVGTSSGTTALHLALKSLLVQWPDEVIIPDYTFPATGNVVFHCEAKPVLCDIRAETFQIDPEKIEDLITPKTMAIMPVSQFGLTADMKPILEIAEEHNVAVVEDACPGLGSKRNRKFAGTFGDVGCFSFHPRKLLAVAEGGMLVTDNEELADEARCLRDHGRTEHWGFRLAGYNYRLSDVQSAIGRVQLKKLPKKIRTQRRLAKRYNKLFEDALLKVPVEPKGCKHTYQSYVCMLPFSNKSTIYQLRTQGIEAQIGTTCLHTLPPYKTVRRGLCPNSFKAFTQSLTLPLYPSLTKEEQDEVGEATCASISQTGNNRINEQMQPALPAVSKT